MSVVTVGLFAPVMAQDVVMTTSTMYNHWIRFDLQRLKGLWTLDFGFWILDFTLRPSCEQVHIRRFARQL